MTVSNYATEDSFRQYMKDGSDLEGDLINSCLTAASRFVDGYCGRYFYQNDETQYFFPYDWWTVDLEDMDIAVTDGLVVSTDDGTSGTWSTVRTLGTDYILEPRNQSSNGLRPWPFDTLRIISPQSFWPIHYVPWQQQTVQVQATFGWPAVPDAVSHATKIVAAKMYSDASAPGGVLGFNGWGEVRVKADAPAAAMLLQPYRKNAGYGIA